MKGFTLIESVVALAILALSLAVVYQIFGSTLHRGAEQRRRDQAWLTAQSLLDQLRADPSLAVGEREGRTPEGVPWRAVVKPYEPDNRLLEININVGRNVELSTLEFRAPQ
jgi:general secretion pathway protein I